MDTEDLTAEKFRAIRDAMVAAANEYPSLVERHMPGIIWAAQGADTPPGDPDIVSVEMLVRRPGYLRIWFPGATGWPDGVGYLLSEALTGDVRVMVENRDGETIRTLYRRNLASVAQKPEEASNGWHPVASMVEEYGDGKASDWHEVEDMLAIALGQCGQTLRRGFELDCTDGRLLWEYDPDHGRWAEYRILSADPNRLRPVEPYMWRERCRWTVGQVADLWIPQARRAIATLTGNEQDASHLLLALGAPLMRDRPRHAYILSGPGGTGTTMLTSAINTHLGGCLIRQGLLPYRHAVATGNLMFRLASCVVAVCDGWEPIPAHRTAELAAWRLLTDGALCAKPRRFGYKPDVDPRNEAVILMTSNTPFVTDDTEGDGERFVNIPCPSYDGLPALRALTAAAAGVPTRDTLTDSGLWVLLAAGCAEWVARNGRHA